MQPPIDRVQSVGEITVLRRRSLPRRFTSVLLADIADYSRLTGLDEDGVHQRLFRYRRRIVNPAITGHGGRVFRGTGDGFLAEFGSTAAAVFCALHIQHEMAIAEQYEPPDNRLQFRIGISSGEVIADREMLYGETVNIAARIEALAPTGGVVLSHTAFSQVRDVAAFSLRDMGEHLLKNIKDPVRVYQVCFSTSNVLSVENGIGVAASHRISAEPALAVLPFEQASDASALEKDIALALFESITTRLAAYRWFRVVPDFAGSNMRQSRDPIAVARELETHYVVRGFLRLAPATTHITLQLLDGLTGHQLLARVYERRTQRLFASHEEIIAAVVAAIELEMQKAERVRSFQKTPDELDAYDLVQRAHSYYSRRTRSDNDYALKLFTEAAEYKPMWAPALTGQAACLFWAGQWRWADEPEQALREALRCARQAVIADDQYPPALLQSAQIQLFLGQQQPSLAAVRRALELNPSYSGAWAFLGHALTASGRFGNAVTAIRRAFALTPYDARRFMWLSNLALAHFHLGNFGLAAREAQEAVDLQPDHWLGTQVRIAALTKLGQLADAKVLLQSVREREPNTTLYEFANRLPYIARSDLHRVIDALASAGWT